ncbi:MAG: cell division protein ZapA [Desulfobacterales bacterium]|nr:MAG: cell division protein ZapA [Desulfobacterales bacterium]
MEQLVTIELFGQPYTFKTESDVSKAEEVAEYLVEEVTKIETQHSKISSNVTKLTTLILAALNIANENIELKKTQSDLLKDISKRSTNLIRAIDAAANIESLKQVDTRNI